MFCLVALHFNQDDYVDQASLPPDDDDQQCHVLHLLQYHPGYSGGQHSEETDCWSVDMDKQFSSTSAILVSSGG